MCGHLEIAAAAPSGGQFTRQKSHQRQTRPLADLKWLNELFFRVLKRGADRIHGRNRQAHTSHPDVQQGTAKAARGQLDSEQKAELRSQKAEGRSKTIAEGFQGQARTK